MPSHDCQCADWSTDHPPRECPHPARHHVHRDGKDIWVCSECIVSSDKELHEAFNIKRVLHAMRETIHEDSPADRVARALATPGARKLPNGNIELPNGDIISADGHSREDDRAGLGKGFWSLSQQVRNLFQK